MTLELGDVSLTRASGTVLERVSFTLNDGSTGMITGATGAGKSTLLRIIAGLTRPTSGTITFGGDRWEGPGSGVPSELRNIGMVFQDLVLWPHLRVAEQIEITLQNLSRADRRTRTSELLGALEIADVARRFPGEISGGQQQRVAIGRAMARRPRLVLLDEPTNQLDGPTAERVSQWLRSEQISSGRILVLVTHDRDVGRMLGVDGSAGNSWELVRGSLLPQRRPI
jgi:iron(III) transport system ATP-binding protein